MTTDFDARVSNLELDLDEKPSTTSTPAPTQRQPIPVQRPSAAQTQAAARAAQDVERVDAAGAARASADEKIAKSLGFAPKPPVFQIGTVVNSWGVDNFKASREEWDKLPTLPELARTFSSQVAKEQRKDLLCDAQTIRALGDGRLDGFNGVPHLTSERALDGLATHVTPGGASYLKQCPADLRATNLNHWLSQATTIDARASRREGRTVERAKQLTLRTRARKGGQREVYSVVGPRYAAYNVDQVVADAAAGIGGDARGDLRYDGYKITLDAMFHSNIAPENAVAGEFFKGCVRIQAADDGTGAIRVSLGLWRNLCRNLIIVDFDKVLVGSRKHVGKQTIASDVAELMSEASRRIDLIVGKWNEATTEDVLARYDLQDVDAVFRGLVINKCVHVAGVKPDDMVTRLHEAWEREPGYSKTAILNAITRAAHEHTWGSWTDSEDLESQAGELLYAKVWNLDIAEKTAEQLLA